MARDPRRLALAYVAAHHVMTLATSGEDGVWAAPVFYAHHDFDLFFLSADHTRHVRHIVRNPRAAAAIHDQESDWTAIQGIQLEGIVTRLQGAARAKVIARYAARFPYISANPELSAAFTRVSWFRLRPERLYFVDNSQGLGHRDTVALE
jgi:uncharacterized protein